MLNDNKSIENKQINVISPLVKKIMKFNSIFMMGSMVIMVIGLNLIIFSPLILPVSITHRGITIQEGFDILIRGSVIGLILICQAIPFFEYGITTLRYLRGKEDLLNKSIGWGCNSLLMTFIDCLIMFDFFKNILIIILLVVFIFAVFFNLLQLHSQENLKH